jgi:hypothetical protein
MARREPVWGLILGGGLLAAALAPRAPPEAREVPPQASTSLATGTARELRAVPGLGERRALALVDARWRRSGADPPLFLGDIAGVGPASEVQVALWLALATAGAVQPSRRR